MSEDKTQTVTCAACSRRVCPGAGYLEGPDTCPTKTRSDIVEDVMERYRAPEVARFARAASLVEGSAYTQVPWASAPTPQTTRLEEIIRFALRMGYRKLGVAFCIGLASEAEVLVPLLENCGFEIVSVCCKAGGVAKEDLGIKDSEKINPGRYESMCNPICQAEILNREKTDYNIMMGLCVGHDSLFLRSCDALTTVFAVKDRVLGHNPLAALYTSRSYYRRLRSKDLAAGLMEDSP
jgi:uncharacterized metal-binding protein